MPVVDVLYKRRLFVLLFISGYFRSDTTTVSTTWTCGSFIWLNIIYFLTGLKARPSLSEAMMCENTSSLIWICLVFCDWRRMDFGGWKRKSRHKSGVQALPQDRLSTTEVRQEQIAWLNTYRFGFFHSCTFSGCYCTYIRVHLYGWWLADL